jgi:hypothetical protein
MELYVLQYGSATEVLNELLILIGIFCYELSRKTPAF